MLVPKMPTRSGFACSVEVTIRAASAGSFCAYCVSRAVNDGSSARASRKPLIRASFVLIPGS